MGRVSSSRPGLLAVVRLLHHWRMLPYFVLHYDEDAHTVRIIPLEHRGTFIGRREGTVKWKTDVLPRPEAKPGSAIKEEDKRY